MIPGWLKSFAAWLIGLFVHEAVEQVKEEVEKPSTIQDEKVPDKLVNELDADLANKLREQQGSDSSHGSGPAGS